MSVEKQEPQTAGYEQRNATLFIKNLDSSVTESMIYAIFSAQGELASVRIIRSPDTNKSLGYGYVNFVREEDAANAMDRLNFMKLKERVVPIMRVMPDPNMRKFSKGNLIIRNLSKEIGDRLFFNTFKVFGPVCSCVIARSSNGKSLGYGFVHFLREESALSAIETLNGATALGKEISIFRFEPKEVRGSSEDIAEKHFTNVYVKNYPPTFTEEKLRELFSQFGTITSLAVGKDESGNPKGFAFINFEMNEMAVAAINTLNKTNIEGKPIYVCRAKTKDTRLRETIKNIEQLTLREDSVQTVAPPTNLYVKNFSENMTSDGLRELFCEFGEITRCEVMCHANGVSKCFGFVNFAAPESAKAALDAMNRRMVRNKPLYVSFAQKKEARRDFLKNLMNERSNGSAKGFVLPEDTQPVQTQYVSSRVVNGQYEPQRHAKFVDNRRQKSQERPVRVASAQSQKDEKVELLNAKISLFVDNFSSYVFKNKAIHDSKNEIVNRISNYIMTNSKDSIDTLLNNKAQLHRVVSEVLGAIYPKTN